MSEKQYRPIAILGIPKKPAHVPDCINIINVCIEKMGNSGDNIVSPDDLDKQATHSNTLLERQKEMSGGGSDRTEQRNAAYGDCFTDHYSNMMLVQVAANGIADYNDAAALIKRNGFGLKKVIVAQCKQEIYIKRKPDHTGTILAEVKAPKTTKIFSIDWEYSYDDGTTWIPIHSTGVCDREISGLKLFTPIKVRARFIIGYDDPMNWMVSNSINL
jgi:hypothetical protein